MKITFIVPIKGAADLERARAALLPSFCKFFRLEDLHEFILFTPEAEIEAVKETLFFDPALDAIKYKLTFIEDEYLRSFFHIQYTADYNNQMLLKLLAHELIATDIYGVCDADCYLVAPCGSAELAPGGRCLRNFAPQHIHAEWWAAAREVLDYRAPYGDSVFGVTPALLYKKISYELVKYMETKNILDDTLCIWKNVTEYTLYWTWILKHHQPAEFYHEHGTPELSGDCAWSAAGAPHLPEIVERQFSRRGYYFSLLQSNTGIMPPDYLTRRFL